MVPFFSRSRVALALRGFYRVVSVVCGVTSCSSAYGVLGVVLHVRRDEFFSLSLWFLFGTLFLLSPTLSIISQSYEYFAMRIIVRRVGAYRGRLFDVFV